MTFSKLCCVGLNILFHDVKCLVPGLEVDLFDMLVSLVIKLVLDVFHVPELSSFHNFCSDCGVLGKNFASQEFFR